MQSYLKTWHAKINKNLIVLSWEGGGVVAFYLKFIFQFFGFFLFQYDFLCQKSGATLSKFEIWYVNLKNKIAQRKRGGGGNFNRAFAYVYYAFICVTRFIWKMIHNIRPIDNYLRCKCKICPLRRFFVLSNWAKVTYDFSWLFTWKSSSSLSKFKLFGPICMV